MGMDLNKKEELVNSRLEITHEMKENLLEAIKWIRFMNVVGCVSMGLLAFVGLMLFFNEIVGSCRNGQKIFIGLFCVILAAIYYPVLKRVFAFVRQARCVCEYNSGEELNGMFDSLRFVSKYLGIICAVVLWTTWPVVIIFILGFVVMMISVD